MPLLHDMLCGAPLCLVLQRNGLVGSHTLTLILCSAFDLEDKVVGTVGCGRIGQRVLQRLAVSPPSAGAFQPCGSACSLHASLCALVFEMQQVSKIIPPCFELAYPAHTVGGQAPEQLPLAAMFCMACMADGVHYN